MLPISRGCNVGYAFVNFIRVQDMLKFAKKRLGVKWCASKFISFLYLNLGRFFSKKKNPWQEHVLKREGSSDELRELSVRHPPFSLIFFDPSIPLHALRGVSATLTHTTFFVAYLQGKGSAGGEVQKFVYYG